mgnify:CR=1 FL=1
MLVMGVSGTGKSSVGEALATALGARFIEADAFHAPEAVDRMRLGAPLTDADRWDWLDRVAEAAAAAPARAVIACSALKRAYRRRLERRLGPLAVVYLHGDKALVSARMSGRSGHFMPVTLVDSQFADLERPQGMGVLRVGIDRPLPEIVEAAHRFAAESASRNGQG